VKATLANLAPITSSPDFARLADILRGMPTEAVDRLFAKTERLSILLTPQQKDDIVAAAELHGLTITEYVTRALALVELVRRERDGK